MSRSRHLLDQRLAAWVVGLDHFLVVEEVDRLTKRLVLEEFEAVVFAGPPLRLGERSAIDDAHFVAAQVDAEILRVAPIRVPSG